MSEIRPDELGERLIEIQELDTRIFALQKEIEGLEEKHQLTEMLSRLSEERDLLAQKEQQLEDLKHKQHKLDGELDLLSAKIKKEEEKLFSGQVMNPKELSAIQAEILSLRKKSDDMETEDLEEMEQIDGLGLEVEQARTRADEVYEQEQRSRDEYNRELAEKEHQIKELTKEKDELKGEVDPEIIEKYEDLLREKGGLAVVRIDRGRNCGGCHLEFSRTQIDRFLHEEGVFACEYCRRILVK